MSDRVTGVNICMDEGHLLSMLHHCSFQTLTRCHSSHVMVFTRGRVETELMLKWIPQILPLTVIRQTYNKAALMYIIDFNNGARLRITHSQNVNAARGTNGSFAFTYPPGEEVIGYIAPVVATSKTSWLIAPREED